MFIVTTAKKGLCNLQPSQTCLEANSVAKHLEPLKGGKVPLEILVRGKDAEQNEGLFEKITDNIRKAGVSHLWSFTARSIS